MRLILTICFIIVFSFFNTVEAQTSAFQKDSLRVVKNANELLTEPEPFDDKDRVISYLKYKVVSNSEAIEDFIQFELAKYFYITQRFAKAAEIVDYNIENNTNKFHTAKFYNLKGAITTLNKEYKDALVSFLEAAKLYQEQGDILREYSVYNNVANIYLALRDYDQAYRYSSLSLSVFKNNKDSEYYLKLLGVLAVCENNLEMLDSAEVHIDEGLKLLETRPGIVEKTVLFYAKTELEFKKQNYDEAKTYILENIEVTKTYGLYDQHIISSILLARIYNETREFEKALQVGLSTLEEAKRHNNLSVEPAILDAISDSYANLNMFEKAYIYKKGADSIKSIDRQITNKERIDFLMEEYQSLVNENKILQQEASIASLNRKVDNRNRLAIFSVVILMLIIFGVVLYNRQKIKIINREKKLETIEAVQLSERKERQRLSSELHDGLASELTALRLELEQIPNVSQKSFDLLSRAHNITRVVSHNMSPYLIQQKGLVDALSYICKNDYSNMAISFYSNIEEPLSLRENTQIVLFRCTQELIQNALKHSNAESIVVQVLKYKDNLTISVEDDGIGFELEKIKTSIGLGSLVERINTIGGEIDIDSSLGKGTNIFIKMNIK